MVEVRELAVNVVVVRVRIDAAETVGKHARDSPLSTFIFLSSSNRLTIVYDLHMTSMAPSIFHP